MDDSEAPDHYETLQLSPRADGDTINRVFRHLAKRLHPDNAESGDAAAFKRVMEAFQVLSDPELRAAYDANYERMREARWRIFDRDTASNDVDRDRRIRSALLSVLYAARRNDPERPGLGGVELERLLDCPEEHLKFHVWYLKENQLIQRTESGAWAITATGVDHVLEHGRTPRTGLQLLAGGSQAMSV